MNALRARLFDPPNAVADLGIDLRRGRPGPAKPVQRAFSIPAPKQPQVDKPAGRSVSRRPDRGGSPTRVPEEYRWTTLLQGLEPQIPVPSFGPVASRHITSAVAKVWDIQPKIMMGEWRVAFAVQPRQVAMALIRHLTNQSLLRVGRLFNRDHTSVLHATWKLQPHIEAIALTFAPVEDWVAVPELHDPRTPLEWAAAMKARLGA